MFLSNDENEVKFKEFIRPFATNSWVAITVTLAIGIAILSLILRLQPYTDRAQDSYGLSIELVFAALAQQGIGKIFIIFVMIYCR